MLVERVPVPLEDARDAEFVVFRGGEGLRDQVASSSASRISQSRVPCGSTRPASRRILFDSLRCGSGDQLRDSVRRMAEDGGGILLVFGPGGARKRHRQQNPRLQGAVSGLRRLTMPTSGGVRSRRSSVRLRGRDAAATRVRHCPHHDQPSERPRPCTMPGSGSGPRTCSPAAGPQGKRAILRPSATGLGAPSIRMDLHGSLASVIDRL